MTTPIPVTPTPPRAFDREESTALEFATTDGERRSLCLLVIGDGFVSTFPLPASGDLVIGRADSADVAIEVPSISRRHALLHVGSTIAIEDLGSVNGTYVRDAQLCRGHAAELSPGEMFELGSIMLVLQDSFTATRPRRIWTHGYFEGRLEEECARAERAGDPFAVLRVRIVHKKPTSVPIPELLLGAIRPADIVATYGPDDYEVLLVDSNPESATKVVERVRDKMARRGAQIRAGLAHYPQDGRVPEALMAKACEEVSDRTQTGQRSNTLIIEAGVMASLHRMVERVAAGNINVLILGETGVGKEIIAERIHALSPRVDQPLLRLNCAALTETILESELFGHARGAFTGATAAKAGLLETAHGGTVFLDEIGDMPLSLQAKLLRVIEERRIRRVGSLVEQPIDVRFVAATNRNLEAEAEVGRFRRDLYYRLNGISLVVPPLRARTEEIAPLAQLFIDHACRRTKAQTKPRLSAEALSLLRHYPWPGNLRELRNVIERAVLLCPDGTIGPEHLPADKLGNTFELVRRHAAAASPQRPALASVPENVARAETEAITVDDMVAAHTAEADLRSGVQAAERRMVVDALQRSGGNQTQAARLLGVSRRTLISRMEAYGLPRPRKHD
jgi:transcriptional regulator with GAF, ATPase, and Fis domain